MSLTDLFDSRSQLINEQIDGNPELHQYYQHLHNLYENEFVEESLEKENSPIYVINIDKVGIFNREHVKDVLAEIEETLKRGSGMIYDAKFSASSPVIVRFSSVKIFENPRLAASYNDASTTPDPSGWSYVFANVSTVIGSD